VTGSGASVRIVVIAVRKISAVIEEKTKSGVAELIAIAFEIVSAELIDHDHDYQLGMAVVGRRSSADGQERNRQQGQRKKEENALRGQPFGGFHREGSLHSRIVTPKSEAMNCHPEVPRIHQRGEGSPEKHSFAREILRSA
jgi:hypothetical protein